MVRKSIVYAVGGVTIVILMILGRIAEYLLSEFVYCRHSYIHACSQCVQAEQYSQRIEEPRTIPKHLHQIFFFETDKVLPAKLRDAQLSWKQHHPDYAYTLWNKTSMQELIRRDYSHFETLYNSYGHWVQRADMARYIVMHRYGGWYIDIDIRCKHGIQNLSSTAVHNNKSIVVRWTEPFGCSNDFIGVTPRHPFFLHVLHGMTQSNRWFVFPYTTTMFSTGPTFLWGRMLNYPYREEDVHMVTNHSQYFDLMHGSSWHSWDGTIVWFLFNQDNSKIWNLLLLATVLVVVCVTYLRRRKYVTVVAINIRKKENII